MILRFHAKGVRSRRGLATVELAIILPLLAFLFLVVTDFCRIFHYSQVVINCARNGAMYAADPVVMGQSPYASLEEATKADAAPAIRNQLNVSSTTGSDTLGSYVRVTVTYTFHALTSFPGIPREITITRTVEVRVAPVTPAP
jgi:Flp pilus assembly protein TadG